MKQLTWEEAKTLRSSLNFMLLTKLFVAMQLKGTGEMGFVNAIEKLPIVEQVKLLNFWTSRVERMFNSINAVSWVDMDRYFWKYKMADLRRDFNNVKLCKAQVEQAIRADIGDRNAREVNNALLAVPCHIGTAISTAIKLIHECRGEAKLVQQAKANARKLQRELRSAMLA